ncbi:DNA mismatch repair protein MutL [Galbibacter marinus]|uniref:DNA mismatch repair protein MutL n=1 Tax=Galbibacter marinus TaxID=555500 RepID=K2QLX4_9FLAO|nr:DNA mismatch repair endonuclease MutL [Galbibacter marinus]EKF55782.1 DNA mismatch repair protein MutL [Galbibacter marinus]
MADIIQLLPDHVANQIAAGEVVQRPASVVKELVENAVDAGSTVIQLIIKGAGKTLIQVVDNGKGMSERDMLLSVQRHATSKIRTAEDLFQLHTKGFRGEALASIAAIAHLEISTREEDNEVGIQLKIEGSTINDPKPIACEKGTSIAVKNLFFNIPARRNFLKSDTVELRHIIDEFHRIALAHPDIHFDFFHNNSELFKLPPSNLRQRIVNVFGGKTNEKLVPIKEDTDVVKINGFISKPAFTKKTRGQQFFFVNNRFVKNSYLHHAVSSAFEGLLKPGHHPGYFIFLEVDPSSIDINIHPTKTEVKFDEDQAMYAILRSTVKHSLGQFNVAPVLDFDRDSNLDTPYSYKTKLPKQPGVEVDADFNPFKEEGKGGVRVASKPYLKADRVEASWESLYVSVDSSENFKTVSIESESTANELFTEEETDISPTTYQLHKKYIVTTIKSGMVIINQHRAHQRVLYEQYLKNITVDTGSSQQLLFPLTLEFSTTEMELLKTIKDSLERTGFVFSEMTENEVQLSGMPLNVSESEVGGIIDQLLADLQQEIPESSLSQSDVLAKAMCRTLAVKSGAHLNTAAQESLVNNLFATKEPMVSPFQKPIFITMSLEELDKRFL